MPVKIRMPTIKIIKDIRNPINAPTLVSALGLETKIDNTSEKEIYS
jgi:hypothetical protein